MMADRKLRAYVDIPTHLGPDVTENLIVTNISLSGCLLRTETRLKVGTTLSLGIPATNGRMLRLRGTIAREHDQPNGFGIAFDAMSDEDRRELALLIAESDDRRT